MVHVMWCAARARAAADAGVGDGDRKEPKAALRLGVATLRPLRAGRPPPPYAGQHPAHRLALGEALEGASLPPPQLNRAAPRHR